MIVAGFSLAFALYVGLIVVTDDGFRQLREFIRDE
jgi:hypothetical protein